MLNEHVTFFRKILVVFDLVMIVAAFFVSYPFANDLRALYPLDYYLWVLPVLCLLWIGLFYWFGMYVSFRLKGVGEILWILSKTAALSFFIFGTIYFVFKITYLSRSYILITFALTTLALALDKLAVFYFFRRLRKMGFTYKNILIVGTGELTERFLRKVNATPEFGLRVIGIIDDEEKRVGERIEGYPVIGSFRGWEDLLRENTIDHIFFFVPYERMGRLQEPILYCETVGVPVSVAMNHFQLRFTAGRQGEEFGIPLLIFDPTVGKVSQLLLKRVFDVVFALIGMIAFLPVFIAVAIAVKATSKGPLFFKQQRCTLNGRKFNIYL